MIDHSRAARWMAKALNIATMSPDPSTQNGAVVVYDASYAAACNEFPDGVTGTWERPAKYSYVEHAERGAIYLAAKQGIWTLGSVMYCPWAACADCARAIVLSGIETLVRFPFNEDDIAQGSRWGESCRIGDEILLEGGVKIEEIQWTEPIGVKLRRDGKELEY